MLTQYVVAFYVSALTHLILAVLIYAKGRQRLTNITYALYSVAISWWSVFEAVAITRTDAQAALFWWRLNHVGVIFIPVFFVHFVISLLEPRQRVQRRYVVRATYLFGMVALILNATPILIREVVPKFSFRYFINPGLVYHVFFTLWVSLAVYGLIELFRIYITSARAKRNQLTYFCWSMFVAYLGGIPNFLPTFNIEIPYLMPFGTYAIPLYALATAYAIVRYRLMDISIVITRTAVFAVVYALLLGLPLVAALIWQTELEVRLGDRWWVWVWMAGAGLATAAHYVNFYFQRQAEARLLREQRRYQATLLQASQGMTQIRHLKKLLSLIVHVLSRTVGLTHAMVYLYDPREDAFTLHSYRHARYVSEQDRIAKNDPLIEGLKKARQAIVLEELKAQQVGSPTDTPEAYENTQICAQMERLHAALTVPSFIEQRLIGFLILGEKRNGRMFTTEDLIVFSTLANQAAVAIENARFYEAERDRQAALFHAATLASLGTMASSMGHQVNNRFNVVALISSSQKMKLKGMLGNGADSEKMRKALAECLEQFESLEEEAIQGGQIVASIRKLARPSTDGHKPLALRAAVKAGMDVVQHKVRFDEFDLQLDIPDDLPMIDGDLSQLGECFLNFIDNAYDAIKTKEHLVGEGKMQGRSGTRPYRGAVLIHAWLKDPKTVQVVVADNGTGAHPEDLRKLFIPFYTTKATAEKGTGLGLYVIKQIIEAHGGAIQAKSTYGEGLIFTIELPVAKVSPAAASASSAAQPVPR